jgi:hypothetical protein
MLHVASSRFVSLLQAASAQGQILGDSGLLQWPKKAKNEFPNPNQLRASPIEP